MKKLLTVITAAVLCLSASAQRFINSEGLSVDGNGAVFVGFQKQAGAWVNSKGLTINPDGSLLVSGSAMAGAVNPLDYGAKFNVGQVPDATTTSGSNVVTCPNSDCKFQTSTTHPAKVGQIFFANVSTALPGSGSPLACMDDPAISFGGNAQTTITSVDSDTQIHVSGTADTSSTAGACIAWGDDDTTAINAAATAAGCYGTVVMPVGLAFFQQPIFQAIAGCPALVNLGFGFQGRNILGQGVTNTYLIPTPNFQSAMPCLSGTSGACVGEPNISQYRDFTVWGMGQRCTSTNTQNLFIVGNSTRLLSVDTEGWCARGGGANTIGVNITGQTDIYTYAGSILFGSTVAKFSNNNILFGDSFMIGNAYATNNACPFVIAGTVSSASNVFQGCLSIQSGGITSNNTRYTDPNAAEGVVGMSANTFLNMLGNDEILGGSLAINAPASGIKIAAVNSVIGGTSVPGGQTSTIPVTLATGSSFYDIAGNTYGGSGNIWNLAGSFIADGHSLKASCTGVATASQTLFPFGGGQNISTTTCTNTTAGTGTVIQGARTLRYMFVTAGSAGVNASSGVFTVVVNGSTNAATCTVGTGTSCQWKGSIALADGDRITVQFTTQSADTLANVKVTLGWI